jgi:hypothetical protein
MTVAHDKATSCKNSLTLPAAAFPTPLPPPRRPLRLPPAKPSAAGDGGGGDPRAVPWYNDNDSSSAEPDTPLLFRNENDHLLSA